MIAKSTKKSQDLEIKYVSVGKLIPYLNNARTHSDDQVKQIADSIGEFGFTNPVLIDEKNGVIAGHGRILAAQLIDLELVPTVKLVGLSEAQKKAYVAAKYACINWHYSKCLPVGKLVKIGVWENDIFIGVVIFGRGANKGLGQPFGLEQTEICELVRIALTNHQTPVSRILTIAIKFLKRSNVGLKLIVSFADKKQNHHGGIYQATNWIYYGTTNAADEYIYKNKRWHGRAFRKSHGSHLKYVNNGLQIVKGSVKHRYLMPLDKEIRKQIELLKKPYPKRVKKAMTDSNLNSGGATPTHTLQKTG